MTERKVGKDENKAEALKAFQEDHPGKSIIQVSNENGTRLIASEAFSAAGEERRASANIPDQKPETVKAFPADSTRPVTVVVSDSKTGTRVLEEPVNMIRAGKEARIPQSP